MIAVTAAEMRTLEEETARRQGIPTFTLMDRAGGGVFRIAFSLLAATGSVRAVIVCGKGNNGGDGFVTAELLAQSGVEVIVFTTCGLSEYEGDASFALKPLMGGSNEPIQIDTEEDLEGLAQAIIRADLVIDAILGTGVTGAPRGMTKDAISVINAAATCPVLSVDIPSGVNADTGQMAGEAIRASVTATIGLPKIGLFLYPGAEHVGELQLIDISIPAEAASQLGMTSVAGEYDAAKLLPKRARDAHKGTFGTVGIVAGSRGMTGAAALASQAALRAGVGLVHLWAPAATIPTLESKLTEVIMKSMAEGEPGHAGLGGAKAFLDSATDYRAVLIGPGLQRHEETVALVRKLVGELPSSTGLVLDADGLNACIGETHLISGHKGPTVITPHPGEFARLVEHSVSEVQADRPGWARRAAKDFDCIVVLKGARTLIAAPDGKLTIIPTGNPGMASGGTGDVLSGVIAGLLAQGMDAYDAAVFGAYIHGLAGDFAAEELSEASVVASDLLFYIPAVFLRMAEVAESKGAISPGENQTVLPEGTTHREA